MTNPKPLSTPMATQEFYIRNASETEAHGPFTQEQLVSLAEAGKVDPQTLYYEAGSEQWIALGANAELKAAVFPEKRRLTIKPKDRIDSVNVASDLAPPLSVDDMLAAAEGRTSETKSKRDKNIAYERAAQIGRYACTLMLTLSAGGLLLPSIEEIVTFNISSLIETPTVYFGFVDLFLTFALVLGATSTYPLIRFRAALGIGFLSIIFWCKPDAPEIVPIIGLVTGAVGLYLSTIFVNYFTLALASSIGLGGMAAFAYYMVV